jgi:hypothetical protein
METIEPDIPESDAVKAGIIRGEIPYPCNCDAGYERVLLKYRDLEVIVELDDEVRHPLCNMVSRFDREWLSGAVPQKYAHHRVHSLSPWALSPIPEDAQLKPLGQIPSLEHHIRGWLMTGPPGSSKTTYAAAAITDWLTFRIAYNLDHPSLSDDSEVPLLTRLNLWRAKVSAWTRDMEAWENKDFGNLELEEPTVNAHAIEKATRDFGFSPILCMDEWDKFKPTDNRLRMLYSLVDVVYELNGTIVSTSNETGAALEKRLGEPIYRRLAGKNDDPKNYLVWDFSSLMRKGAKQGRAA